MHINCPLYAAKFDNGLKEYDTQVLNKATTVNRIESYMSWRETKICN